MAFEKTYRAEYEFIFTKRFRIIGTFLASQFKHFNRVLIQLPTTQTNPTEFRFSIYRPDDHVVYTSKSLNFRVFFKYSPIYQLNDRNRTFAGFLRITRSCD